MEFTSYTTSSQDFFPQGYQYPEEPRLPRVTKRTLSKGKKLTIVSPGDVVGQASAFENLFNDLAKRWKAETRLLSSPTEIAMHPAYQRIIGLGPRALPLIIRDLVENPDWWFWALRAISGVDPVSDMDRGRLGAMARAWQGWWEGEGVLGRWKV